MFSKGDYPDSDPQEHFTILFFATTASHTVTSFPIVAWLRFALPPDNGIDTDA